jgi:hypothetical protein
MLTAQDRCQAKDCNAQAWWSTWFDFSELTWCHHHFREYEVKLRSTAMTVMDHRPPESRW